MLLLFLSKGIVFSSCTQTYQNRSGVKFSIWFSTSYFSLTSARYILPESKENLNPHVTTPGWAKPAKTVGITAFALWSAQSIASKRSRRTFKTLVCSTLLTLIWRCNREAHYLKTSGRKKKNLKRWKILTAVAGAGKQRIFVMKCPTGLSSYLMRFLRCNVSAMWSLQALNIN